MVRRSRGWPIVKYYFARYPRALLLFAHFHAALLKALAVMLRVSTDSRFARSCTAPWRFGSASAPLALTVSTPIGGPSTSAASTASTCRRVSAASRLHYTTVLHNRTEVCHGNAD